MVRSPRAILGAEKAQAEFDSLYYPDIGDEESSLLWETVPDSRKFFVKVDGKYQEDEAREWKSERLLRREAAQQEWEKKDEELRLKYRNEDETFKLASEIEGAQLNRFYQSQIARWEGDDNPFHYSMTLPSGQNGKYAKLDWGAASGDLNLEFLRKGSQERPKEKFSRGQAGFLEALAKAREYLS